jgi:hypothetical protein
MPLSRQDTVFVYFSTAFFQGLFNPQYQVELERRMKAVTDIELVLLSRLAAGGEQLPSDSIDGLVAARLLPRGFGRRPDGSGPVAVGNEWLDAGEDPNCYNPKGNHAHSTPLHQAALAGHAGVVRLLVERGARLDIKDYQKPGDNLGIEIDMTTNKILGLSVASYLTDAKDAVTLNVTMASLLDGTGYPGTILLDGKAKSVKVTVTNSAYQKKS